MLAIADDSNVTRLGGAFAPRAAAHPGKTGICSIPDPREAFAARAILAASADRTLDVQCYIWRADETGYLLFEALWKAAERGVRVRLLLDDNNAAGLDATLGALDAHPNIEVRLYNPVPRRKYRFLNYLTDFKRLNRRMHNKSFTADGQATIVGGRNVGNEYFDRGRGAWFKDLDVFAVGAAVGEVSAAFELYWTSRLARPARDVLKGTRADTAVSLTAKFEAMRARPGAKAYHDSLLETPLVRQLLDGELALEWTTARLFRDDPAKTLDRKNRADLLLLTAMLRAIGEPAKSFDLVSPYLVPGRAGTAALAGLARKGVTLRILTNSLAATDVIAVHAGYAKRRHKLLRAGVRLFELKRTVHEDEANAKRRYRGSSSASLHAKVFAIDRARIFVGSFNFDPRSALLNTEMGLMIESAALAGSLADGFKDLTPKMSYEVRLKAGGHRLEWIEDTPSGESRHAIEPATGLFTRAVVRLLSKLPIEWLL